MEALLQTLLELVELVFLRLIPELFQVLFQWQVLLVIVWLAVSLCGINWKKAWPSLGQGAWVPAVLVLIVTALTWSQIEPATCNCLGTEMGNFWWQLGFVSMIGALTLFCGWLQGVLGWAPAEIDLDPPTPAPGHDHH